MWKTATGTQQSVMVANMIAFASFVASRDVSIEQLPGAYHEILNDLGRKTVYERICRWLDDRCGPS